MRGCCARQHRESKKAEAEKRNAHWKDASVQIHRLVFGRALDVVDHDDIDGRLCRFELETELLLQCGEEGRTGIRDLVVECPLKRDFVFPLQISAVDDKTAG